MRTLRVHVINAQNAIVYTLQTFVFNICYYTFKHCAATVWSVRVPGRWTHWSVCSLELCNNSVIHSIKATPQSAVTFLLEAGGTSLVAYGGRSVGGE